MGMENKLIKNNRLIYVSYEYKYKINIKKKVRRRLKFLNKITHIVMLRNLLWLRDN